MLRVSPKNRECNTVDMVWGLGGFQYGLHVNLKRTTVTAGSIPDEMSVFYDKIKEDAMVSTYPLLSTSECGVKTGVAYDGTGLSHANFFFGEGESCCHQRGSKSKLLAVPAPSKVFLGQSVHHTIAELKCLPCDNPCK